MKKRTRIIIFLVFLLALFAGRAYAGKKLENKMQDALSVRYPTDSFSVRDVSLTVIPPGAKGKARAEHEGLDFNVSIFRDIGKEAEVRDDLYESRSLKHYSEIFEKRMQEVSGKIEGYDLEMIIIGDFNRDPESGLYPAAVDILLPRTIDDAAGFVSAVQDLGRHFADDPVEGVEAYTFISFPGSVPEDNLPEIGMSAAWLTAPSPTPTPSPTPRPTTSVSGQTEASSSETSRTSKASDTSEAKGGIPAFAYEVTILTDRFDLDENLIRNSMRSVTYSQKELRKAGERFGLEEEAMNLLNRAAEREEARSSESLAETRDTK